MHHYRPAYQFASPHPSVAAVVRWPISADDESSEYSWQQSWSLLVQHDVLTSVSVLRQGVAPLHHEHQNTGWRPVHQADGPPVRPQGAGPPHRRL